MVLRSSKNVIEWLVHATCIESDIVHVFMPPHNFHPVQPNIGLLATSQSVTKYKTAVELDIGYIPPHVAAGK